MQHKMVWNRAEYGNRQVTKVPSTFDIVFTDVTWFAQVHITSKQQSQNSDLHQQDSEMFLFPQCALSERTGKGLRGRFIWANKWHEAGCNVQLLQALRGLQKHNMI